MYIWSPDISAESLKGHRLIGTPVHFRNSTIEKYSIQYVKCVNNVAK